MPPPRYLDKASVAALFGVSPRTIDVWMKKRLIPFLKIGKGVFFDQEDIHRYLLSKCRVQSTIG
ncbi:MAG: helix-turn-helix domain-containing protein [Verrucomicrobia bacterium]|nr:helix-turn-helix domain-containing protein [Verrucomicrobiota bacterium]